MLNIFKKKSPKINAVQIPEWGWTKEEENSSVIVWVNPEQTIALSLNYFDKEPDLPTIKDVEILRKFYRGLISQVNGGLVEVNLLTLKGHSAVRTIFKIPQEPTGVAYLASLTIPFERSSYVVKIQAPEVGTTGFRDTLISAKLLDENVVQLGENGFENWFSDPYDQDFKEGLLMNKSEDAQYDEDFPDHPLTLARKFLAKIENEIQFSEDIKKNKKFNA
ncbi:hypothetical protein [Haliscomenobacter sp.]|uniref:hypothetical protein n=1 Tax=Haliscomenobacter sp. TaxID=2717303 RepID=UPI003BAAE4AC